ncbi:MAG: LysM peptidoglycan-binding domain-containing protein [Clostridia bacterium]|nr:LysM peptidoglycan-binding domain-containing protein [Clostridia bacterium]
MEKIFYRVKENDCLLKLSNDFNASVFELIIDNNLNREIEQGDVLIINKTDYQTYSVQPLDTLESIAEKFCTTKESLMLKNSSIPYVFYGIKIKI